jgi:hypothetical protein
MKTWNEKIQAISFPSVIYTGIGISIGIGIGVIDTRITTILSRFAISLDIMPWNLIDDLFLSVSPLFFILFRILGLRVRILIIIVECTFSRLAFERTRRKFSRCTIRTSWYWTLLLTLSNNDELYAKNKRTSNKLMEIVVCWLIETKYNERDVIFRCRFYKESEKSSLSSFVGFSPYISRLCSRRWGWGLVFRFRHGFVICDGLRR